MVLARLWSKWLMMSREAAWGIGSGKEISDQALFGEVFDTLFTRWGSAVKEKISLLVLDTFSVCFVCLE